MSFEVCRGEHQRLCVEQWLFAFTTLWVVGQATVRYPINGIAPGANDMNRLGHIQNLVLQGSALDMGAEFHFFNMTGPGSIYCCCRIQAIG